MLLSTPVDVSVGGLGLFEVGGTFFSPCILPLEKNTLPSIENNPEKKEVSAACKTRYHPADTSSGVPRSTSFDHQSSKPAPELHVSC